MCILLRVFIGRYTDPLCGDEPSSNWMRPTSVTVSKYAPAAMFDNHRGQRHDHSCDAGWKNELYRPTWDENFMTLLSGSENLTWRSLG